MLGGPVCGESIHCDKIVSKYGRGGCPHLLLLTGAQEQVSYQVRPGRHHRGALDAAGGASVQGPQLHHEGGRELHPYQGLEGGQGGHLVFWKTVNNLKQSMC